MNITITLQPSPELIESINNLSHSLMLLSTSGNCLSELVEAGVQAQGAGAPQQTQLPPAQPTMPPQYVQPTAQAPVQQPALQPAVPTQPQQATVPTATAPSYTMELLGVAAGPLVDAGRAPELTAWINQRGAQSLSQLDKSHYGEFATYLRSLGARI